MEEATWSSSPSTAVTESESDSESGPADLFLGQNYPNPFNPRTRISYEVPEAGRVVLGVYNLLGEPVRRLVDEHQAAGPHTLTWDGRDHSGRRLASGTYLYRLQAASGTQMRKMLLVR
jgi:hypothetical protein